MWKWAVDRSAVASRWTWLQAQISDLEYRIRKQGDICRQLKIAKSPVSLKDNSSLIRIVNSEPCQICLRDGKFDIKNNHVLAPTIADNVLRSSSITNNAYINSKLPESVLVDHVHRMMDPMTSCEHQKVSACSSDDRTCVASRVRPLQEGFKKRQLVRTSDLHRLSQKVARASSSVRCRCLPHTYCVLCGGRYSLTQPIETDPFSSLEERVSTVDPSYHPVLSFKQGQYKCVFPILCSCCCEVYYFQTKISVHYFNVIRLTSEAQA